MLNKVIFLFLIIIVTTGAQAVRYGKNTSLMDAPWQVSLQMQNELGWRHFCGGSMIQGAGKLEKRLIITAAHCVEFIKSEQLMFGQVRVAAGGTGDKRDLSALPSIDKIYYHATYGVGQEAFKSFLKGLAIRFLDLELKKQREMTTQEMHEYFQYRELLEIFSKGSGPTVADIAIIVLSSDIEYSEENNIMPIDMALGEELGIDHSSSLGKKVMISGWGRTHNNNSPNFLQSTTLYIDECESKSILCRDYVSKKAHTQVYVANGRKGPWQGDSGGPAVVYSKRGYYKLIGITSYGAAKFKTTDVYGGFYTKLAGYADSWIYPIIIAGIPRNAVEINPFIDPSRNPLGVIIHP